jgi:hypothetical protein
MTGFVSPRQLDQVLELERELQTPTCRSDQGRLRQLLAPDFVEIGASGRRWEREDILAMLREESTDPAAGEIEVVALSCRALAPGVVQVFWDSARDGRRARRTSIWCERDGGWQQVYHQGTLLS